mmetsp:Transcript_44401/g.112348  ORF Transcript_44401/g.112348 Transcript_44401/m.112348 type:complete len:263 (+) Transcript_44401:104-892(+)
MCTCYLPICPSTPFPGQTDPRLPPKQAGKIAALSPGEGGPSRLAACFAWCHGRLDHWPRSCTATVPRSSLRSTRRRSSSRHIRRSALCPCPSACTTCRASEAAANRRGAAAATSGPISPAVMSTTTRTSPPRMAASLSCSSLQVRCSAPSRTSSRPGRSPPAQTSPRAMSIVAMWLRLVTKAAVSRSVPCSWLARIASSCGELGPPRASTAAPSRSHSDATRSMPQPRDAPASSSDTAWRAVISVAASASAIAASCAAPLSA